MTLTNEMHHALDVIANTGQCLYITGKAGTGKTTFLKHVVETIGKQFIVTAPTGVAAINAGGVTLHSLLNIPFGVLGPEAITTAKWNKKKQKLIKAIDAIIIDEISMVRSDLLDFINVRLKQYRKDPRPFGGVQIIMFGDPHQLPPVVTNSEKEGIKQLYKGEYFFDANVWQEAELHCVEFTHIFRQSDSVFVDILNNIRNYHLTPGDMEHLEEIRDKTQSEKYDSDYIHICSLRSDVQRINTEMLGEPTHSYSVSYDGDFNESATPCDNTLKLRIGARVMSIVNDKNKGYCNGSLGYVIGLTDKKVQVKFDHLSSLVEIGPYQWEQCTFTPKVAESGKKEIVKTVVGTCTQMPITLAWAITIHKSQGLTFDKVVIHSKGMFCPGQLYVALSRCRTLEGIITDSFITERMIFPDHRLTRFEQAYRENGMIFNNDAQNKMHE